MGVFKNTFYLLVLASFLIVVFGFRSEEVNDYRVYQKVEIFFYENGNYPKKLTEVFYLEVYDNDRMSTNIDKRFIKLEDGIFKVDPGFISFLMAYSPQVSISSMLSNEYQYSVVLRDKSYSLNESQYKRVIQHDGPIYIESWFGFFEKVDFNLKLKNK